jgi:O-antigen ligase
LFLIAGLGFSAYFTGTSFTPSIANNIGPFEMIALLMFVIAFLFFLKNNLQVKFHFTNKILILIILTAIISLPNLSERISLGAVQLLLLIYTGFLVLITFNILVQYPILMKVLLRFVMLGAFVAGTWVTIEGISSNAPIGTGGPFRNRSHVGIYMLTSFWLVLIFFFWPNTSKFERFTALLVILVVLYSLSISGRRSVYLSLIIGLTLLAMSFVFLRGSVRFQIPAAVILVVGFLFFLAQIGSQFIPQLDFFNDRIGLIDDRIELVAGTSEEISDDDNFALLQRAGMIRAISDHPLIGIGWGGFYESEYSPTGHEMHSTPQRYLTELGVIGFSFYMIFNFYLWFGGARLFFRVRNTKYQMPALIFVVAFWSLSLSWAYNRSVTERTYWLLIILFISFEAFVTTQVATQMKPR